MKKSALFVPLMMASLLIGGAASAQSSADPTLVSFVQTAFKNTNAETSLNLNIDAATTNGTSSAVTVERQSSYQVSADSSGGWDVSGTQSVIPNAPGATPEAAATPEATAAVNPNTTTLQMVILSGKTYIRYTAIPTRMEVQNPPPKWTDLSTLPPGTTFGGGIPTAKQILAVLALPIDSTGISSITEQAPTTMDGMSMRVFQITMDTQAVLNDADAVSTLNVGFGGGRPAGARPVSNGSATQEANAPAATPAATPQGMTPANTQLTLTVSIGSDNLVHQITSVVTRTMMGANGQGTTVLTTMTDFTNFNQPVTITAPALGT